MTTEDKFSQIKDALARRIDEIANDPALEAEARAIIAALDLAIASNDYAYALTTRRAGYIADKRSKLEYFVKKVMEK